MSTETLLNWAAEQLAKASTAVTFRDRNGNTVIDRIHDAMAGHPKAARWDSSGAANRPWCWIHEQEVKLCHRNGDDCLADDIVGANDSTGDQAAELTERADRASGDLQQIDAITKRITKETEKLVDLLERWPAPRPATPFERSISADNAIGCESCARVKDNQNRPLWGEPMPNGSGNPYRTDMAGVLTKPLYLCQRCYSHVQGKGILPPKKELESQVRNDKRNCQCPARQEVWSKGGPLAEGA